MLSCLDGTKVLEYTDSPAGAYCARMLADLGAEVIKIEPPDGDPSRARPPFFGDLPHQERSCLFFYLNLNKMGVTLNLSTATGQEILSKLVADADVLVEDQPAAGVGQLGLVPAALLRQNPKLVVTSVTPFGRVGPHSHYRAYPLNVYHSGGDGYLLQSGKQYLHREPVKAGGLAGEYEAAIQAALAVLVALRHVSRTGRGLHVDVSKQEGLLALNRGLITNSANNMRTESRATRAYSYAGMLPCKDGYIAMQIPAQYLWDRLVAMMGNPEWTRLPAFADEDSRAANPAEVNELLAQWLRDYTKDELSRLSREWGVPLAPVATAADIVSSEQLRHREFLVEVEHPVVGKVLAPSLPFTMTVVPAQPMKPAPLLGQHNRAVYVDRLGYSREELVGLRSSRVI